MLIGYVRVSTDDQNLNLQKDALIKYGVDERNIFQDKTSGSKDKRVVKEAKYLLVYTSKTIYSIALVLNFQDASQFTRFFKQKTGLSPKKYRIDNQKA